VLGDFIRENEEYEIYWVEDLESVGKLLVSFDKKKIYNLWTDYPDKFTDEEKEIFDIAYPYWREFFADRQ